jgi:hypothetical protein
MAIAIPVLTEKGVAGRLVIGSHPDVNGKFGGHKAWIVNYRGEHDESGISDRMEIYRHVGNYYEVGTWSPSRHISRWEMVNTFVDYMNENNFGGFSILVVLWMMIRYKVERL